MGRGGAIAMGKEIKAVVGFCGFKGTGAIRLSLIGGPNVVVV